MNKASVKQHIDVQILNLMNDPSTLEQGLRLLMDTYQERLYWHIRGLVKNHPDADDVLQNTFIKVYKNISGFKGDAKLFTWLYRISTNESFTLLQRHQKKKMASLDDDNMHHPEPFATAAPESERIQKKLSFAQQALPTKQRAVFQMRYYDEMSYDDIKNITGTSVGALKASYHHAVKKIENFLREGDD